MVGRGELTEQAWQEIAPWLPTGGKDGQWRDHRTVINGIVWKLRPGHRSGTCPSATVPGRSATTDLYAGGGMACGIGSWRTSRPKRMRWVWSSGR